MDARQSKNFAVDVVESAMKQGADQAQVTHASWDHFELDASTNKIGLVRTINGTNTTISVFRDGRKGSATVTGCDRDIVAMSIVEAIEAASSGPADDANCVATDIDSIDVVHGEFAYDRATMRDVLEDFLGDLRQQFSPVLTRHAIYSHMDQQLQFANSDNVNHSEQRGFYMFSTLFSARRDQQSTSFNSSDVSSFTPFSSLLDAGQIKQTLTRTCQSFDPKPVPTKFEGDVIITPECLSSLIRGFLAALSGASLMSGTSPYTNKLGDIVASPKVSLRNTPRDPQFARARDFDSFGVPTRDIDIISDGRLQNQLIDFFFAQKLQRDQTVGAVNLNLAPGQSSLDELIANTSRGVLLGRFSGGHPNAALDFSGIAKNSFYIQDGKILHPLSETMVSGNLMALLMNVRDLSTEAYNLGGWRLPYLAASGVTISSK